MDRDDPSPPLEGGAQPVPEHATPPAPAGQSVARTIAIALGALAILAALAFFLIPLVS